MVAGARYIGAHCSTEKGLHKAVERIAALDGTALQLFTRSQRRWKVSPLTDEEIADFKTARKTWGGYPAASHDSYLINLASPEDEIRERSIRAFADEIVRCALLGVELLVTHPGNHKGSGEQGRREGLERYVRSLDEAIEMGGRNAPGDGRGVRILLEITAGTGTALGASFEELAEIVESSRHDERLGICLDTCHAFCAGYDLRTAEAYGKSMESFDSVIGLERLGLVHLNDSKNPFGSRKDRHEHIGQGELGLEPFRLLLRDERLKDVPMVLETPKDKKGEYDRMNMKTLRSLLDTPRSDTPR